jgi:recombination protein U
MATWTGRGLRGSSLEELLNHTLEQYREKKLALVQKIPTPITPIDIDKQTRHITLAYFDAKSTVDYIGVVQGIPVCFDAKECAGESFPIRNIHEHQMAFMRDFEHQEGIAFFVIFFTGLHRMFYVPLSLVEIYWKRAKNGGRKSITFEEMKTGSYELNLTHMGYVPLLEALQSDLDHRSD